MNRAPIQAQQPVARRINAEERRDLVMEWVTAGASIRAIQKLLADRGIKASLATIHKDINRRLNAHIESTRHQTETLRNRMDLRIERLLRALWPRAVGTGDEPPDLPAIDRVQRLLAQKALLWGLNAPQQVAVAARAQVEISYNHRVTMPANSGEPDAEGTAEDPRLRLPAALQTYDESGWLDESGGRGSVPVLVREEDDE